MPIMKAAARVFVMMLAVALVAAPVLLDGCLMTCQAPTTGVNRAQGSPDHSCHHAGHEGSGYRFQSDPTPCGHDHSETASVLTAETDASRPLRLALGHVAVVTVASLPVGFVNALGSPPSRSTSASRSASSLTLPLRL